MKIRYPGFAAALLTLVAGAAVAAPYTANSPVCTPSATAQTCRIELLDFMKSQFNWTTGGKTFTSDSTNLAAAANSASTSSFRYIPRYGSIEYVKASNSRKIAASDIPVKTGYMNHPTLPNVLLFSKTGSASADGGPLEVFRWAGGNDNAMWVTAESGGGWRSYEQRDLVSGMNWINRGYFWADKTFDVTRNPNNPAEWVSTTRSWGGTDHDVINLSGLKVGITALDSTSTSLTVRYYPADNGAWINNGGGNLPTTPMEILETVYKKYANGVVTSWEKFRYARQKLANGSYNYFGLIFFQSTYDYNASDRPAYCSGSVPPADYSNGECGENNLLIRYTTHYNALSNALDSIQGSTVKAWYDTALSYGVKNKNNPMLTKRAIAEDPEMTQNRGGFVPPGDGQDAFGNHISGSLTSGLGEMVYLSNTTFEQDWYIYPNGKDPLFAPRASDTNYCREGYKFLASFPAIRSYNGLNRTVESGALHWVIVCGSSTDAYFHGSDGGSDPGCPTGYIGRTWFTKPTNLSMTACTPSSGCLDLTAKSHINLCVKHTEMQEYSWPAKQLQCQVDNRCQK